MVIVICPSLEETVRAIDAQAPTVLIEYAPELRAIESNWPKIRFHALREHAGLVFQKHLDG